MTKLKKFLASLASVAVVLTTSVTSVQAYNDVASDAWFAPYVEALAEAGVFDSSKASFRPADNMNRAEFVKTLVEAAGINTSGAADAGFSDVSSSQWFAKYVNAAAAQGFIDGPMADKGNKFFPEQNISRAAAVKIALGAFGINADNYQSPAAPFADVAGHWGESFITAAYNLSIVDGVAGSKDTFAPNENIARSAVAKIAAYSVIVADEPDTYVRFEDGTSAFSTFTADNVITQVKNLLASNMPSTPSEDEEEDTTTPVVVSDGTLEISLSSDSPKGAVIPYSIQGVTLAKYDLTANGDDVKVQSVMVSRKGIGDNDDISEVVVYDENGRISNSKTFNTDDEATITFFSGGLNVQAGETRTISIVGSINSLSNGTAAGNRDAVSIVSASAVGSNATEVVGDFPVTGSTFEIGSVAGATVNFQTGSSVANVKIGEEQVAVEKIKINNGSSNEDVELHGLTLKQIGTISEGDEIANFSLYLGTTKLAAGNINGNYVSFNLATPYLIKQSKTESLDIKADIIGGAGDSISFELNKTLDLRAVGKKYGYGAGITNQYTSPRSISVEAGKVSIVKVSAESDKVRKDKDNIVFGKIKVTANAGSDLEMEKVSIEINNTDNTGSVYSGSTLLENIELYDEKSGAVYALTCTDVTNESSSTTNDLDCYDADLNISLSDGETRTFAVRVDTKDTANINGAKFQLKFPTIGTTSASSCGSSSPYALCIKEMADDKYVTDITPSSLSYNTIDGQTSAATLTSLSLSSAKNAVVGASDIVVLDFEVEADETSALRMTELKVDEVSTTATGFQRSGIASVKLWKKEGTNETLIAEKGGSQISADTAGTNGELTFNDLDITIPRDEKVRFVVTISVVDDSAIENRTVNLQVGSLVLEDDDSDDVTSPSTVASARTITYVGKGTLSTFAEDPSDDEINNKNRNVLADTTTGFVDSFEMKTTNEPVKVKTLRIKTYSGSATATHLQDMSSSIESISLYDNDKTTLLATETVSASTIEFKNLDYIVDETTKNLYVKYKLRKIGKDYTGVERTASGITMALFVTDAAGQDSGDTIVGGDSTTDISTTNPVGATGTIVSYVVATQITDVDLVSSYGGVSVSTDLDNGDNVIAIVKITAASSTNTSTAGSALKAVLQQLQLNVTNSDGSGSNVTLANARIQKIGGNGLTGTGVISGTTEATITFTGAAAGLTAITSDASIIGGSSYYKITATVSGLYTATNDPSGYLDVDLDDLNSSNVTYKSCKTYACSETASSAATITAMNFLNKSSVDTPQISQVK